MPTPAKPGRAERLFETLQDRLVKELRLAGISTPKQANRFVEEIFVPKFNSRFAVLAQKKGNLHKSLTQFEKDNLDKFFSVQTPRTVNNDFTVKHQGKWYQLAEQQPTLVLRKDKVLIEERLDDSIRISLRNRNPRRRSGGVLPKQEEPTQFCENHIFASQKFRKIAGFMYSPPLRASLRSALRFGLAFNPAHGGAGFSAREYKELNWAVLPAPRESKDEGYRFNQNQVNMETTC